MVFTLWLLGAHLAAGGAVPLGFNDSPTAFVPKGDFSEDDEAIMREVFETRPLGLKNADLKSIAGVTNHSSMRAMASSINKIQRGFVSARQIIANFVILDAAAQAFGACGLQR